MFGPMSGSRPSDEEITRWATAARTGDRAALERFVRGTRQELWRYLAHLTDVQLADDLAQETCLRVLRALAAFEGRSSARTWLLSIARRVVIDHLRATGARPRRADLADWQAVVERTQPPDGRIDETVVLTRLVDGLDDDRREAFVLTQQLGLSYAEAAEICRCPVGTIRSRVARARDDLISSVCQSDRPRRSAV